MATRNAEVNRRSRWLASAALVLMAAASAPARADTVWSCWYNGDTRIQCMLAAAASVAAHSPYENATLPGMVKQLWERAHTLTDKRVFIPLFNEPEDWERVRLLAESVMCGNSRACSVDFSRSYAEAALLAPGLDL